MLHGPRLRGVGGAGQGLLSSTVRPALERDRHGIRDSYQPLGPERLPFRSCDLVLPDLDAEVGTPLRVGMPVHGRIEQGARIGLLVADHEPLGLEERNGEPRGAIVGVVEDADVPWTSLFGLTLETRCKAVQ